MAAEEEQTTISIEMTTEPWILFLYAVEAPAATDKYIQKLTKFLDFLGYQGTKEEKARAFAAQAKADPVFAFNSVVKFFQTKREQIDRKETAIGTVRNYVKSIKLFIDMSDVHVPWAKIIRGLPRAKRFADDRTPTLQEICRICEYPTAGSSLQYIHDGINWNQSGCLGLSPVWAYCSNRTTWKTCGCPGISLRMYSR